MKSNKSLGLTAPAQQFAQRLGHVFTQPQLLQQALTHRSFSANHNERLEFLGDAVLDLAITDLLYQRLQHAPEGDLSRIRANLVCQESLHSIATQLNIAAALRLGAGELSSGGLSRPSILADAFEAVLGAVYLDAGFSVANNLVQRLFEKIDISMHAPAVSKDAKTTLQEWLQARKKALPAYSVQKITGQAHQQVFTVACAVAAFDMETVGSGTSRRMAEQAAAEKMLQQLPVHNR